MDATKYIEKCQFHWKLPPGWTKVMESFKEAYDAIWVHQKSGRKVVLSICPEFYDSNTWVHVSISRRGKEPSYQDLVYLKRHWLGDNLKAIMVLPEKERHVNIHPNCLHLYCCLDGDVLPDFTMGMGTI